MPLYEFECEKCRQVSSYFERLNEWHWLRRKCQHCGSRKTKRVLSTFSAAASRTYTETLNELKSMGNVTFVPQYQPPMPPEMAEGGKCPYCGSGPDGGGGSDGAPGADAGGAPSSGAQAASGTPKP